MDGDDPWALDRLPIIRSHHMLASLGGLTDVIMRDLREEVVDDVGANVVVDDVEERAVVSIYGGQTPAQVAPLLLPAASRHTCTDQKARVRKTLK